MSKIYNIKLIVIGLLSIALLISGCEDTLDSSGLQLVDPKEQNTDARDKPSDLDNTQNNSQDSINDNEISTENNVDSDGLDIEDSNVSQVSEGYYGATYQLTGNALKNTLNDIITENHGLLTYDQVYSALEDTDVDPMDPSRVLLFYKGVSVGGNELRMSDDGDIWNREHIWAKSHGDFGTKRGPGSDLHMIRATDASVNARRGHLDFDESDEVFPEAPGTYVDKDSFEPRDEVKGDVARMLFYMAVRYEGENGEVDLELSNRTDTFDMTRANYGEHGKLETLLKWNILDPVDDLEMKRNERIYKIQGNRNPFIDHPEFVSMIWGGDEYDTLAEAETSNDSSSNNDSSTDNDSSTSEITPIDEAREMSNGKNVSIVGTITFIENDSTMYIQDEFGGIRVDSYGSNVKLLKYVVGRKVLVEGELDSYKGEKEILIESEDSIRVLDSMREFEPQELSLIELSDGYYQGQLVHVKDVEVVRISSNIIVVQDDKGYLMNVFYKYTNDFDSRDIEVGRVYQLTGIASWYEDIQVKLIDASGLID